jgi:hypothetical protein
MERQRDNGIPQEHGGSPPKEDSVRKPYTSPQLREWGSIQDLTQGPTFTFTDFPKGGSRPT